MADSYEEWMKKVDAAFESLNVPMADWQARSESSITEANMTRASSPMMPPKKPTATGGSSGTSL